MYHKLIITLLLFCSISFGQSGKRPLTDTQKDSINALIALQLSDSGFVPISSNVKEVGSDRDYTTISSAITAASTNDVIKIYSGIYSESITIDKSVSIVGEGTNTSISNISVTVSDTVKISNLFISPISNIGLSVASGSTVLLDNITIKTTSNITSVITSSGKILGSNVNVYSSLDKININGGEINLTGNEFYTEGGTFRSDAKGYFNYNKLMANTDGGSSEFWWLYDQSEVNINAQTLSTFYGDFSDSTLSYGRFFVSDSGKLTITSNGLTVGAQMYGADAEAEIKLLNCFSEKGDVYIGKDDTSLGDIFIRNSYIKRVNNRTATHLIEDGNSSRGNIYLDNNHFIWAVSQDGASGNGNLLYFLGSDVYSHNNIYEDLGGDSSNYNSLANIRVDGRIRDFSNDRFIYSDTTYDSQIAMGFRKQSAEGIDLRIRNCSFEGSFLYLTSYSGTSNYTTTTDTVIFKNVTYPQSTTFSQQSGTQNIQSVILDNEYSDLGISRLGEYAVVNGQTSANGYGSTTLSSYYKDADGVLVARSDTVVITLDYSNQIGSTFDYSFADLRVFICDSTNAYYGALYTTQVGAFRGDATKKFITTTKNVEVNSGAFIFPTSFAIDGYNQFEIKIYIVNPNADRALRVFVHLFNGVNIKPIFTVEQL